MPDFSLTISPNRIRTIEGKFYKVERSLTAEVRNVGLDRYYADNRKKLKPAMLREGIRSLVNCYYPPTSEQLHPDSRAVEAGLFIGITFAHRLLASKDRERFNSQMVHELRVLERYLPSGVYDLADRVRMGGREMSRRSQLARLALKPEVESPNDVRKNLICADAIGYVTAGAVTALVQGGLRGSQPADNEGGQRMVEKDIKWLAACTNDEEQLAQIYPLIASPALPNEDPLR